MGLHGLLPGLTISQSKHKSIFMRTTLDLPEDVGRVLREESARRGGRGSAPLGQLVAEAVRARFGGSVAAGRRKIVQSDGFPVVRRVRVGETLDQGVIDRALEELP